MPACLETVNPQCHLHPLEGAPGLEADEPTFESDSGDDVVANIPLPPQSPPLPPGANLVDLYADLLPAANIPPPANLANLYAGMFDHPDQLGNLYRGIYAPIEPVVVPPMQAPIDLPALMAPIPPDDLPFEDFDLLDPVVALLNDPDDPMTLEDIIIAFDGMFEPDETRRPSPEKRKARRVYAAFFPVKHQFKEDLNEAAIAASDQMNRGADLSAQPGPGDSERVLRCLPGQVLAQR